MIGIKRLRSLKISENWYKRTTRNNPGKKIRSDEYDRFDGKAV